QPAASDIIDDLTVKWVAAFLDSHPLWPMPHREDGLYGAWRTLAAHDPALQRSARRKVKTLPPKADAALSSALVRLNINAADRHAVLRAELASLPGWASHIKWRAEHVGDINLVEYLAVRLSLRAVLGRPPAITPPPEPDTSPIEPAQRAIRLARHLQAGTDPATIETLAQILSLHPTAAHLFTFQRAYELHYQNALLSELSSRKSVQPPQVQLVACIDTRSEGLRRHLEALDERIETFGAAGFFGVPIRFASFNSPASIDSMPALLTPRYFVTEKPANDTAKRHIAGLRFRQALAAGLHASETTTAAPFIFAEATGWIFGVTSALRTLVPSVARRWAKALEDATTPALESDVTVAEAFTLEERAGLAEATLRMIGLGQFAPLVIFCGHRSTSTNNLYESSLDCGACGGNPGNASARAAAAIFNDPEVRALLRTRGLDIPSSTFFLAAVHDTTSDHVTMLDTHLVPSTHRELITNFDHLQAKASDALVLERAQILPGSSRRDSATKVRRRAADWAEVYPEWGLAANAAFLVGPRELTRGVDLNRRVFLHSYEPELDPNGAGLETILTAPVVVAQWINHQYYFSALHPETFGAGTKTIHNAIGTIGVFSGQGGDLRRGLPWQSVGIGDQLIHEPMRLAVVVQAPLDLIARIVNGNAVLRTLFDNGWITLTGRATAEEPWSRYGPDGWSVQIDTAAAATTEGAML
ncbi:MAG: DUF2309 domain-containing protein, partial [Antricoccus sp.]